MPNSFRLAQAGFWGALLLMACERALLAGTEWLPYSPITLWLWLPLLLVCHWFPYSVVVLCVLHATRVVIGASAKFSTRRKLLVWAALASPLVVYAALLSWYTFSGAQARDLWYRPIGIALLPIVICGALLLPFLLFLDAVRGKRQLLHPPLLASVTPAEATRAVYLSYYGWHGMVHGAHKLVMYQGGVSLVNLHEDPHEWHNVADAQPELVRQLKALTLAEQRRIQRAFSQK